METAQTYKVTCLVVYEFTIMMTTCAICGWGVISSILTPHSRDD
jgi:hypothetical protein